MSKRLEEIASKFRHRKNYANLPPSKNGSNISLISKIPEQLGLTEVEPETRTEICSLIGNAYNLADRHIGEIKDTPFENKYLASTIEGIVVIDLNTSNPTLKKAK